jgi:hypothetical protein
MLVRSGSSLPQLGNAHGLTVAESPSFDRAKTSVELPSLTGRWFSDGENALTGNRARRTPKNYSILGAWTHASNSSDRKPSIGSQRKPKLRGSLSMPITVLLGLLNERTALAEMAEAEFEAFIEDLSKGSERFPPLPPDFSRADIYTDHD